MLTFVMFMEIFDGITKWWTVKYFPIVGNELHDDSKKNDSNLTQNVDKLIKWSTFEFFQIQTFVIWSKKGILKWNFLQTESKQLDKKLEIGPILSSSKYKHMQFGPMFLLYLKIKAVGSKTRKL